MTRVVGCARLASGLVGSWSTSVGGGRWTWKGSIPGVDLYLVGLGLSLTSHSEVMKVRTNPGNLPK